MVPPAALYVTDGIVTVFVVTVGLPVNVIVPVALQTVAETKDIDPAMFNTPVPVKVTVPADTVMSRQLPVPVRVTVYVPA
jgi:hypothetical protein